MLSFFRWVLFFVALFVTLMGGALFLGHEILVAEGPLDQAKHVEIPLDLKEGDLLAETYFYSRDDTRDGLLLRMKEAMDKALDEAWRKRVAGLPLVNRREALVLASMIEKETAVPAERARVAAVFL